jgi:hypothetical protein
MQIPLDIRCTDERTLLGGLQDVKRYDTHGSDATPALDTATERGLPRGRQAGTDKRETPFSKNIVGYSPVILDVH